jgi:acyl carrier protein
MEDAIKRIVKRKTGKDVEPETNLIEIVEDSLGKVELLAEIEAELKVRIDERDLLDMETVSDLLEVLRR